MTPLPILLIHGFNGQPANWTMPGVRFTDFLAEQGFDPALIRNFSYGFIRTNGAPIYNATGDMRAIAHRLDEADSTDAATREATVEQLSRDSVARGGPEKITIIAHSGGGLIARYYLSCQTTDEFGTQYRGKVGRMIMLGTPHLGADIESALDPLPSPLIFALLSRLHPAFPQANLDDIQEMRDAMKEEQQAERKDFMASHDRGKNAAYQQLHPKSEFLAQLNRPGAMPDDVSYFNVAGDVRISAALRWKGHAFVREQSLGDLAVSRTSAATIPNARSTNDTVVDQHEIDIVLGGPGLIHAEVKPGTTKPLPNHGNLRGHPAVKNAVLKILRSVG